MANVAYIRVSTSKQNTDRQLANCGITFDETFEDKCSAKTMDRPAFTECMKYLRKGDHLHVHSLDRVCRSGAGDAVALVNELTARDVSITFHKEGMIFHGGAKMSAAQKGVLGILAAVADMERELINERRIEGIEIARSKGKVFGRPKTAVTKEQLEELKGQGLKVDDITKQLGISRATFYRVMGGESAQVSTFAKFRASMEG